MLDARPPVGECVMFEVAFADDELPLFGVPDRVRGVLG